MKNEIERKFLVKDLPDLTGLHKVRCERYYVFNQGGIELRVQKKGELYELERKVLVSELERTRDKLQITEAEFSSLTSLAKEPIVRDNYTLSESPQLSLKIYHNQYKGLVRAEVEFDSLQELQIFNIPSWFGKEITHTPLSRDALLVALTRDEFRELLSEYSNKSFFLKR